MSARRRRVSASRRPEEITPAAARRLGPATEALIKSVREKSEAARRGKVPRELLGKDIRPSHPGKPHGMASPVRYRCVTCGYIVNDPDRFKWEHKHQKFLVEFGGRLPGGKGVIKYTDISDEPEYRSVMLPQIERVARSFGFQLAPLTGTTPRRR